MSCVTLGKIYSLGLSSPVYSERQSIQSIDSALWGTLGKESSELKQKHFELPVLKKQVFLFSLLFDSLFSLEYTLSLFPLISF